MLKYKNTIKRYYINNFARIESDCLFKVGLSSFILCLQPRDQIKKKNIYIYIFLHIWDCRRKGVRPNLEGFKFQIKIKYQTEKYIATKNNDLETFYRKWTDNFPL